MKEFEGLRGKKYSYLTDDNDEIKLKRTKKGKLKFEDYKNLLEETPLENKIIHQNNNRINVKYLT